MMDQEEKDRLRKEKAELVREYLRRADQFNMAGVAFFTLGWLSGEPCFEYYLEALLEHFREGIWSISDSEKEGG